MSEIKPPPRSSSKENENFTQGLRVVVENPGLIYKSMHQLGGSPTPSLEIQDDQIDDVLCGYLTTKVSYYDAASSYNPNSYNFSSEIHNEGRKLGQLPGFKGYVDANHLAILLEELQERIEGKFEVNESTNEKKVIYFEDSGEKYVLDLGFAGPAIHRKWVEERIAQEKSEGRTGYYTSHPEIDVNENISLSSVWHKAKSKLDPEGVFQFKRDLEHYGKIYEECLHALYVAFDQPEPDKVLKIKPQ